MILEMAGVEVTCIPCEERRFCLAVIWISRDVKELIWSISGRGRVTVPSEETLYW